METLKVDKIVKGTAVHVGHVEIVPLARWIGYSAGHGEHAGAGWIISPIGIQILTESGTVGLDLHGRESEELARL